MFCDFSKNLIFHPFTMGLTALQKLSRPKHVLSKQITKNIFFHLSDFLKIDKFYAFHGLKI